MEKYKIVRQGVFETNAKFDDRVNDLANSGWKAISITSSNSRNTIVLMEFVREDKIY